MTEISPPILPPRREWLSDAWRIGFILLLTLATRGWLVAHTEVLSRDSIGFIRYALTIEDPPSDPANPNVKLSRVAVLQQSFHPPGYAVAIIAVSQPVRAIMGTTSESMALSAQLTSVLTSLLIVFPLYFLGKILFDRPIAFVGTLIHQILPVCEQITSDGLSDGLFMLTMATALWFTALAFRRQSYGWFFASGAAMGLSYLVRPEGLVLLLATGLVMMRCRWRGEVTWRKSVVQAGALFVGLLVVTGPYIATIGRLTNKPTGNGLLRWLSGEALKPSWVTVSEAPEPPEAVNIPLARWWPDDGKGKGPTSSWAFHALVAELLKATFYVLPFFSVLGLFLLRHEVRNDPGVSLLLLLGVCDVVLLWFIASGAGYLAERHALPVVLSACYFAAAAFPILGEKLAMLPLLKRIGSASFWGAFLVTLYIAAIAPAGLKTLHPNRGGHLAVGRYLAAHAQPGDMIVDPFAWAEFHAGYIRSFPVPSSDQRVAYAVLEGGDNTHQRLHLLPAAKAVEEHGRLVYWWPEGQPPEHAKVRVYRYEGDDFAALWHEASKYWEGKAVKHEK